MPISVQCPSCQKKMKANDALAGKRVKCPACGEPLTVEPAPAPVPAEPAPARKRSEDAAPASAKPARTRSEDADEKPKRRDRNREDEREDRREPAEHEDRLRGVSPDYRIDLSRWFAVARANYRAVLGPALGYLFLVSFVLGVVWVIFGASVVLASKLVAPAAGAAVGLAGAIPIVVFLPALLIGFHIVCQKQIKGEGWNFGTFFSGFRYTLPLAGRALLLGLVEVATAIPIVAIKAIGEAVGGPHPPELIGLAYAGALGCAIVGWYVFFRLTFFSHHLMIDRDCGTFEALRGSWRLTRGHFWGLLGTMLLVFGALNLTTVLALVGGPLLPTSIALFAMLPLLVIGAVVQLIAFPAVILFLNAGYLLVAGKEPLPDQPEHERAEPRPATVLAWLPVGLVSACVVLVGAGMTVWETSERDRLAKLEQKHREESARRAELAKQEYARARAAAEQEAKELVGFFRDGGHWSMELSEWAEAGGEPAAGPPWGGMGPPGAGGPPTPMGGTGMGGGAAFNRPRRVLVLGPRDMLKTKPAIKLGVPQEPNADGIAKKQKIEDLPDNSFVRDEFFRFFAEAMSTGAVEAVLVEVVFERPKVVGPGMGGAVGPGAGPPGGGAAGAGDPFGPGGGDAPRFVSERHGMPVPLDKAKPLTRDAFQKLIDNQYGTASGPR